MKIKIDRLILREFTEDDINEDDINDVYDILRKKGFSFYNLNGTQEAAEEFVKGASKNP
ncbi:MAG: hypothetical protein ACLFP8_02570 [Alphaproteobacteria bacterium]